ncbi:MAG: hypothetical protein ABW203_05010 [Novosphingobium sp.]
MRVALLSTLEPATDAAIPRGLLHVGGRAIVQHQLGAAIASGCERVVCLTDGQPRDVLALQRLATRSGLSFSVVGNGHDLARLILPQDEVLILADGLLAAPDKLAVLVDEGRGVLTQPAERGLAAGFERIDAERAAAGVLLVPGALLSRLTELPSDWSPGSALLRLAAQAQLPRRDLPAELPDDTRWTMIRSEAEAQAFEPRWLRLHTAGAAVRGAGPWLAAELVQRLGPELLHTRSRPRLIALLAAVLTLAGAGLGWAGATAGGLILLGLAWLASDCADLLTRIDRHTISRPRPRFPTDAVFAWALDGAFVLCCVARLRTTEDYPQALLPAAFAGLSLFGMLRLIPRIFAGRRWSPWFEDRLVAALFLLVATATHVFATAVMVMTLMLIAFAIAAVKPDEGQAKR